IRPLASAFSLPPRYEWFRALGGTRGMIGRLPCGGASGFESQHSPAPGELAERLALPRPRAGFARAAHWARRGGEGRASGRFDGPGARTAWWVNHTLPAGRGAPGTGAV